MERKPSRKTNTNRITNPKTNTKKKEYSKIYKELPTEFIPNDRIIFRRRYASSGSGNADFTITDLLGSKIMAATAVLGYSPYYSLRLICIKVWAPVTTIGSPVSLSLFPKVVETDTNCFGDAPMVVSDTSVSITKPAFIKFTPNEKHPAGSWHYTNAITSNLFKLFYPVGSIMELTIEAIENVATGTLGYAPVLVGATPGGLYTRAVLTNFAPINVNSI